MFLGAKKIILNFKLELSPQNIHNGPLLWIHFGSKVLLSKRESKIESRTTDAWCLIVYGISGFGVSRPGILNKKGFCIKINLPKGNYWILRIGLMGGLSSLQKSEFFKLIISFFHYFWCQNWDQWHKMSGKNTHIYFFYFWFKNKRVWAEKIRKNKKIPKS